MRLHLTNRMTTKSIVNTHGLFDGVLRRAANNGYASTCPRCLLHVWSPRQPANLACHLAIDRVSPRSAASP